MGALKLYELQYMTHLFKDYKCKYPLIIYFLMHRTSTLHKNGRGSFLFIKLYIFTLQ